MFIPPPLGGEAGISSPAANYVNYFGMANGLPIDAAGSGYTITDPWSNRDPRFYKSIVYDGVRMIRGTGNAAYSLLTFTMEEIYVSKTQQAVADTFSENSQLTAVIVQITNGTISIS